MLGAPALDLQLQCQLGFAAEVRHNLSSSLSSLYGPNVRYTEPPSFGRENKPVWRLEAKNKVSHWKLRCINTKHQRLHTGHAHHIQARHAHPISSILEELFSEELKMKVEKGRNHLYGLEHKENGSALWGWRSRCCINMRTKKPHWLWRGTIRPWANII